MNEEDGHQCVTLNAEGNEEEWAFCLIDLLASRYSVTSRGTKPQEGRTHTHTHTEKRRVISIHRFVGCLQLRQCVLRENVRQGRKELLMNTLRVHLCQDTWARLL